MSEFIRENRYEIIKNSDIEKYLSDEQIKQLMGLLSTISFARQQDNRGLLKAVAIESDWPCYDSAWQMIEALTEGDFSCPYEELAKANERVRELEAHNALLMQASWEMKEGKPDAFYKIKDARSTEPSDALNRFAIEKKIEAIKLALDGERFELDGRPLDFGIRVESLELMLRDFEIGLNSMPIRKGGES